MRARMVVVGLTVLLAFALTGCGDSKGSSSGAAGAGATQSSAGSSSESSTEATAAAAKQAYEACINVADEVPESSETAKVKKQCKDHYEKIKDAEKRVAQSVADARAKCEAAAKKIPNQSAQDSALASCLKIQ